MVDGRPINYQNGNHSSIPLEVLVKNLLTECSLNRSDISFVKSLTNGMNTMLETQDLPSAKQNVMVTTAIHKNCQSAPFLAEDLFSEESSNRCDQVTIFAKDNILKCSSTKRTWIKAIRLAEDCQSYNLELRSHSSKPTFTLTATKKIQPSECPILWFSQEILMSLRVPHLSLTNIQGEKKYICHRCPFQCEMPNPLKIHLALECGTLTKEDLWQRLRPLRIKSPLPLPTSPLNFSITSSALLPTPVVVLPAAELMTQRTTSISAFKPYQKPASKIVYDKPTKIRVDGMAKIYSILPPASVLSSHPTAEISNEESKASGGSHSLVTIDETTILYERAVEMETIASNLGKFKQGHLCIYCGKVYSRKYGLKIHIRTHTGFKPLKCKFCLRPFGDPSNLNKHVRLHSEGDAPYKCDQCGKILVRKRDLDRHVKSRH